MTDAIDPTGVPADAKLDENGNPIVEEPVPSNIDE